MARRPDVPWDLLLVASAVLALDALAAAGVEGGWRAAVALPALLVAPGHALVAAFFPRRHRLLAVRTGDEEDAATRPEEEGLAAAERLGLSLVASLILAGLAALAAHASPWGLDAWTFLAAMTLVTLACVGAAHLRRLQVPPEARMRLLVPAIPEARGDRLAGALLVVALLVGAGAVAYGLSSRAPGEPFSEVYLLPEEGGASDLPHEFAPGQEVRLRVGLANHERAARTYRVEAALQAGVSTGEGGDRTFAETSSFPVASWQESLSDGERRERALVFTAPSEPGEHRLVVLVEGGTRPLEVHLFLTVAATR